MVSESAITLDQLKAAVAGVKKSRPAYKAILSFYGKIFLAQESSKKKLPPVSISVTPEMASIKHREGFPLISLSEFVIDNKAAEKLFIRILKFGEKTRGPWADFSSLMTGAMKRSEIVFTEFIKKYLDQEDAFFNRIAEEQGADSQMLGMTVYQSIRPSLEHCAARLSTWILPDSSWERGYCPICGSQAGISVFAEEGRRFFCCHFCYHRWSTRRIFCPYCGNRDGDHLHYLYSEEEKGYRIDTCEQCKKYIKTVDIRELDHDFYPPLEQISTLHLDVKAHEMGYQSPIMEKALQGRRFFQSSEL
ncbi:MAG: formate dehydrogenase accessory protein FdhE [Thermodesulfobacteriota bacterium]